MSLQVRTTTVSVQLLRGTLASNDARCPSQKRNLARRFIVLLDELYNARVALVCQAAAPPEELFAATADDDQAVFDPEQLEQLQFESAAEGALRHTPLAGMSSDATYGSR